MDVDLLVGAEEIPARLGLRRYQRAYEFRSRHEDFAEPLVRLKRTMVRYWPDVERWARSTGRPKGRR